MNTYFIRFNNYKTPTSQDYDQLMLNAQVYYIHKKNYFHKIKQKTQKYNVM